METQTEPTEKQPQKSFRTALYLSGKVHGWALKMMEEKGFEKNFSAYIADLIRRDYEARSKKGGSGEGTDTTLLMFAPENGWNSPFVTETPFFPAFSQ